MRIPFPQAYITLPSIIIPKFPAKILRRSPAMKHPVPKAYNLFVGNFVMRKAVSGMTVPIAREYPLVTHCPVSVLI